MRAIVEGDLFLSRILLSSFFFSHPESCLKIKIFVRKSGVLGEEGGPGEKGEMKKGKKRNFLLK